VQYQKREAEPPFFVFYACYGAFIHALSIQERTVLLFYLELVA